MKCIVVSGVNLVEGGTLTILRELLRSLDKWIIGKNYRIIVLTHDKNLCFFQNPQIEYQEYKYPKKNWFLRLYFEYIYCYFYSKKVTPYLWLSVHDMTPNVCATKRVVYCHNPTPFYHFSIRDLKYNYKILLFSLFYKYLYKINMRKNDFVIVQQNWIRNCFVDMFSLNRERVIVAYPKSEKCDNRLRRISPTEDKTIFFYPSLSRPFKNFELIGEAVKLLDGKGVQNFEVVLTVSGTEDNYAKRIFNRYKHLPSIKFIGRVPYEQVLDLYDMTTCLLFPSKLETWGLGISEFSLYNKPMLIADLPYAQETASNANYVSFFNPSDALDLSLKMEAIIRGDKSSFKKCPLMNIQLPFTQSWCEMFELIF